MDELIAKAWRFVRERFRSYQAERKSHGRKRDTARRDASRQRHDIETRVRQQLTREYATGRFRGDKEALKREVERRVQERMLLSRGNNYTRLATAPYNIPSLKIRPAPEAFTPVGRLLRIILSSGLHSSP
uniref:IncFII RepA protein family protein n=1 Tax=Klebsiella pneumoniae TaxID=573 RepID=A0A2P1BPS6_KLEPN|nr:IncFII RepA protein family protein [Klebsiella pneumoniae]